MIQDIFLQILFHFEVFFYSRGKQNILMNPFFQNKTNTILILTPKEFPDLNYFRNNNTGLETSCSESCLEAPNVSNFRDIRSTHQALVSYYKVSYKFQPFSVLKEISISQRNSGWIFSTTLVEEFNYSKKRHPVLGWQLIFHSLTIVPLLSNCHVPLASQVSSA